ncbi:MAG: response regulator, partial [Deltaproteobacteria bacterium]|nr:response regulator [Deltaproteobacteria bacterium]
LAVESGELALQQGRDFGPDVAFIDASLPGLDGYEVTRAIKSDPQLAGTSVILMASQHRPLDEARASEVGADDHILKPFDTQEAIDKATELARRAETLSEAPSIPLARPATTPPTPISQPSHRPTPPPLPLNGPSSRPMAPTPMASTPMASTPMPSTPLTGAQVSAAPAAATAYPSQPVAAAIARTSVPVQATVAVNCSQRSDIPLRRRTPADARSHCRPSRRRAQAFRRGGRACGLGSRSRACRSNDP